MLFKNKHFYTVIECLSCLLHSGDLILIFFFCSGAVTVVFCHLLNFEDQSCRRGVCSVEFSGIAVIAMTQHQPIQMIEIKKQLKVLKSYFLRIENISEIVDELLSVGF